MTIRKSSSRTSVNASFSAAATSTPNQVLIAPSTATSMAGGAGFGMAITSIAVMTDATYTTALDDTAVNSTGGFIRITGSGFAAGANVYFNGSLISNTFINSTQINAVVPATNSGTYSLQIFNTNSTGAIYLPGIPVSGFPTWTTGLYGSSSLTIGVQLQATGDAPLTFSLQPGSNLPAGLTLTSGGFLSGTLAAEGVFSFVALVNDAQLQTAQQSITFTVTVVDPFFKNNTLLLKTANGNNWLKDVGVSNLSPTVFGDAKPAAFSPYNTAWSVYFDGTGDYLLANSKSSIDWLLTSGNSGTIEAWIFPTGYKSHAQAYQMPAILGLGATYFNFGVTSTGLLRFYWWTGSPNTLDSSVTISLNTWVHVALVLNGTGANNLKLYVNGVNVGTGTFTNISWGSASGGNNLYIGAEESATATSAWQGYISNLRISNNAVYTNNFTPATSTLTTTANTTLLTCHTSRFIDQTGVYTFTKNGDAQVAGYSPFAESDSSSGSAFFDGSGDYLTVVDPNIPTILSGSAWTIQAWVFLNAQNTQTLINTQPHTTLGISLNRTGIGDTYIYIGNGSVWVGAPAINSNSVGNNLRLSSWNHVALVKNGNTITLWHNGTSAGTTSTLPSGFSTTYYIGSVFTGTPSEYVNGYFSNYDITDTALYTSPFTPPANATPPTSNTKLGLFRYRQGENSSRFLDSSVSKLVITRTGSMSQGSFGPFSPTGWSTYFNGSNSLTPASGITAAMGGGFSGYRHTIECFVFPTFFASANGYGACVIGVNPAVAANGRWTLTLQSNSGANSNLSFDWTTGTGSSDSVISSGFPVILNSWNHIAVTINATTPSATIVTLFVNGSQVATKTNANYTTQTTYYGAPSIAAAVNQFANPFYGYISNLRILFGVNQYSGSYTVPTAPLTAITGTVFLTAQSNRWIDNSSNALAITPSGNPTIQAFSPFAPSAAYSPSTHGGSGFFNGSSRLQTTYTGWANGAVTIEGWFYITSTAQQQGLWGGGVDLYGINLEYNETAVGANKLHLFVGTGSAWSTGTQTATNVYTNQWYHIAYTKTSGNLHYLYINGVVDSNINGISLSVTWSGTAFYLGVPMITTRYYNGYISGFKITPSRVYTGNFTVPSLPPDLSNNPALLCNFTDASIYDASGKNNFESVGDVRVRTSNVKFSTTNTFFGTSQANGNYVVSPNDIGRIHAFGTGDFTVEAWIYFNTTSLDYSSNAPIVNYGNGGANGPLGTYTCWVLNAIGSGSSATGLRFYRFDGTETFYDASFTFAASTWYHVAACRSGTSLRFFVNGSQIGTTTTTSLNYAQVSGVNRLWVGIGSGGGGNPQYYRFPGSIEDVRVSQFARYTGNFTVPVSPLQLL